MKDAMVEGVRSFDPLHRLSGLRPSSVLSVTCPAARPAEGTAPARDGPTVTAPPGMRRIDRLAIR
jgi:hypothetical protein